MALGDRLNAIRGGNASGDSYRVLNMPRAAVYFTGAQSFGTSAAFTVVSWDTEEYDSDSMWDPALPTRLTANTPGVYFCTGTLNFAGSATGYRDLQFLKNGTTTYGFVSSYDMNGVAGANNMTTSWPISLNRGDYVELRGIQTSGGSLALTVATATNRYNGFTATLASTLG